MTKFHATINYRTQAGGNTWMGDIEAADMAEAATVARAAFNKERPSARRCKVDAVHVMPAAGEELAPTEQQPYRASIQFERAPHLVTCTCGGCDWKGTAAELLPVDDCILTPGDESPAGRCPVQDCGALAYVVKSAHKSDAAAPLQIERDLLVRAESFIAGFEDDDGEQGAEGMAFITALLADLRKAIGA